MTSLILNSTYYTKDGSYFIRIGLDSTKNFEPYLTIAETGQELIFEYDNDSMVVLSQIEWFKLMFRAEQIDAFFKKEMQQTEVDQIVALEDTFNPTITQGTTVPVLELGNYLVEFNSRHNVLRFNMKACMTVNIPCLDITFHVWKELFKLYTCISYKLKFINHYKFYAKLVHSRILNYFINHVKKGNEFSVAILEKTLIELKYDDLQKGPIDCNYACFDMDICNLIDAEIRACSLHKLFLDISAAIENAKYFSYQANWW